MEYDIEDFEFWFDECEDGDCQNLPLNGSPAYPRIFVGDTNKEKLSDTDGAKYKDDNIHTTWLGLISYYG